MTLKEDMLTDLDTIFSEDEFGTTSILTTAGPVVTNPVITFHKSIASIDPFTSEVDIPDGSPGAIGKESDFLAADVDDKLIVDSVEYFIVKVINDDTGMVLIILRTK